MHELEMMVTWYFNKRPQTEYHIFLPMKTKDPYLDATNKIKKQYRCNDADFAILSIQQVLFEKI